MSNFGSYSGEEFLGLEIKKRDFLIDKILRELDSVILVGAEKAGKSILAQQLIFSLTTGDQPFLDEFEVLKPCKVTYVQVEGELGDSQDRYRRMRMALDFDPKNFHIIFSAPLELQDDRKANILMEDIAMHHVPNVLIFDPLYFCFTGSLSDDGIVRKFLGNIRRIKDRFSCAVIIVHHTHRMRFNKEGDLVDEGDDAIFGSSALKWWPDHIIFFTYNKKRGIREFRCTTQRSGDILDKIELKLEQPIPLYFRGLKATDTANGFKIMKLLELEELSCNEMCDRLEISRASFYRDVKPLLKSKAIGKTETSRPVTYSIREC